MGKPIKAEKAVSDKEAAFSVVQSNVYINVYKNVSINIYINVFKMRDENWRKDKKNRRIHGKNAQKRCAILRHNADDVIYF